MDTNERCFFCKKRNLEAELIAWFVNSERRIVHLECWAHYRAGQTFKLI